MTKRGMFVFTGEDGSMGYCRGRAYRIYAWRQWLPGRRVMADIEGVAVPYGSWQAFEANWRPLSEAEAHQLDQMRALVVALASCVLAFDMYDGLYQNGEVITEDVLDDAELNDGTAGFLTTCNRGHHVCPKAQLGFIEGARAALFEACQDRPELLEGTNLTVQPWDPEGIRKAGLIYGPRGDA